MLKERLPSTPSPGAWPNWRPPPVPLLLVTADFRSSQERFAESEACYREIIEQRPDLVTGDLAP